ncbi:MAG: GntR family transcriptional regulator [Actinomycetota bacterium]
MAERHLEPVLQPAPLKHAVYDALEERIIYGVLPPGAHLVETDLANQLGVSRAPVREALHLLHRDGWVELRPRQGAFVHQPSIQEVDEVFQVRTLLEAETARLAAANCSEDDLAAFAAALDAGEAALENRDERGLVEANSAFHLRVTAVAGNGVLARLIAKLDKQIRWYFAPIAIRRAQESWREHAEIVKAIQAADQDRARELMRKHAESTRAAYHTEREQQSG